MIAMSLKEHTHCNKNIYRSIQVLCTCFPLSAFLICLDFIFGNAYERRTCLVLSIDLILCCPPHHRILMSFFLVFFFLFPKKQLSFISCIHFWWNSGSCTVEQTKAKPVFCCIISLETCCTWWHSLCCRDFSPC